MRNRIKAKLTWNVFSRQCHHFKFDTSTVHAGYGLCGDGLYMVFIAMMGCVVMAYVVAAYAVVACRVDAERI